MLQIKCAMTSVLTKPSKKMKNMDGILFWSTDLAAFGKHSGIYRGKMRTNVVK